MKIQTQETLRNISKNITLIFFMVVAIFFIWRWLGDDTVTPESSTGVVRPTTSVAVSDEEEFNVATSANVTTTSVVPETAATSVPGSSAPPTTAILDDNSLFLNAFSPATLSAPCGTNSIRDGQVMTVGVLRSEEEVAFSGDPDEDGLVDKVISVTCPSDSYEIERKFYVHYEAVTTMSLSEVSAWKPVGYLYDWSSGVETAVTSRARFENEQFIYNVFGTIPDFGYDHDHLWQVTSTVDSSGSDSLDLQRIVVLD